MATKKAATKNASAVKKSAGKSWGGGAAKKASGRRYSPDAGEDVAREMRAMKQGKLKSGGSGTRVTTPTQAIAIGLSEARKEGKKVAPPPKN